MYLQALYLSLSLADLLHPSPAQLPELLGSTGVISRCTRLTLLIRVKVEVHFGVLHRKAVCNSQTITSNRKPKRTWTSVVCIWFWCTPFILDPPSQVGVISFLLQYIWKNLFKDILLRTLFHTGNRTRSSESTNNQRPYY